MKKRILLVENDSAVAESLKKVIADSGYGVRVATTLQEGRAGMGAAPLHLLLLDLDLPDQAGWDILEDASERHPSLPVILITAFADQCERGVVGARGCILEKPLDADQVLEAIAKFSNEPADVGQGSVRNCRRARPSAVPVYTSASLWQQGAPDFKF